MPGPTRISCLCLSQALLFGCFHLQAQAVGWSVLSFGAVPDGIMRSNGSMSAGSPILSSVAGSFTPADQGKYIQVVGAGPGATSNSDAGMSLGSAILTSSSASFAASDVGRGIVVAGAGPAGGNLRAAIQNYLSKTSVTLSVPAQTAIAGAAYYYGAMTLESSILSVQSSTSVTLNDNAQAPISGAVFAYGTDNHLAFQTALDSAGQAGGGQVNVPSPSSCPDGAVCGYVVTSTDQTTAQAPGSVKIRYSDVSLIGDSPQTNLFCRGAYGTYTNSVAFSDQTANIRGFCLTIGDNGGPNGSSGTAVSNVIIANLHLYGLTDGNTNRLDFAFPPTTADSWDITHKGIYMWDHSTFSNITINAVTIQDFKAENIFSGGSVITGMIIENCVLKNFNGDGISMLASDLQVLNNNISNGSNAAVENATSGLAPTALGLQLYQGNTISQFPREGIVITGIDDGVSTGSVTISGNTFDTIAQSNASGAETAVYITGQTVSGQPKSQAPANVTVSGNTCHDCNTFGVFQTSGNTVVANNNFIVDQYSASAVFSFAYALSNVIISGNTGSTTAQAQANNLSVGDVFLLVPPQSSGGFQWNNVVIQGNSWAFPGAPEYQFVTTSGPAWGQVSSHNLRWEGDVCTGCTHADADHGLVNLAATKIIEPYGPTVYVSGNDAPVTVTLDAGKEEDQAQVQIVNAGSSAVSFASDKNLSLPFTITLPGGLSSSITFLYSAALGKFSLLTSASNIAASGGNNQSANLDTPFSAPLQVLATDSNNNPIAGATIVFSAPAAGPTARFNGFTTAAVVTGANGIASSPLPSASGLPGSYAVTAALAGTPAGTTFALANVSLNGALGMLTGSGNASTTTANLTLEGGADWIHWGDAALNRKSGSVTAPLSNYAVVGVGGVNTYSNDPRALTWTDGSPNGLGNNHSGIYINSLQNGFAFSAPADFTPRTLTVHVGGWLSGGTFTAHLSDASAPDFVDSTSPTGGQYDRNYTLTYNAVSAGQTLAVSWVTTSGAGNVTLNGAALSLAAPTLTASGGTPQSAMVGAAFGSALQATVKDFKNNPLSGVTVTFTTPATGASATFNGSATATALTNSSGMALAPTLTANSQTGAYTVTANIVGAVLPASFSLTNTNAPASVTASGGTPQNANLGTPFITALQATVKDVNNNPVSGVIVTFTTPSSGASAAFGGSLTATATSNALGIAIASPLTANSQPGLYLVTASVAGLNAAQAVFSLTNDGPPASISANTGSPQSATVSSAFTTPLQAIVKDANNNPVSGVTVTFAAPVTGASALFSGSASALAITNASGIATAPALTANSQAGGYPVTATAAGLPAPASFALTNTSAPPASVAATAGTPQSTTVGTAFATPLQALVKDANSNPVSGVTVTFTAPNTGVSAAFNGLAKATAITNASGIATAAMLTANTQAGSYPVAATVTGVTAAAAFSLTNLAGPPAGIAVNTGSPQSATVSSAFTTPLQAIVKDANNNPVSGVTVTFAAPVTGASALFSGSASALAITNASGIATAPALTANSQAGGYPVTATAAGLPTPASFALTNTSAPPASVAATAGTPQSTTVGTAFATPLQALVKDANSNPVSGVTVTFTAPNTGVSAAFNGLAKATAITNASGIATAAVLTANTQAGSYPVAATVTGVTAAAAFSLTNLAGPPAGIAVNTGSLQSATVSSAFTTPLQAIVKDANNNPVSGVTVTFTSPVSGANASFNGLATATASTNASGVATASALIANAIPGSYLVTATAAGLPAPASFSLTNIGVAASITATGGTPQSTTVGTVFSAPLQATVKDAGGNPLSGVSVTFTAPASGPGAAFLGLATTTAITNAGGIATAPALTANSLAGGYTLTAAVAGVNTSAAFSLTNLAAKAASIGATAGTPQSVPVNSGFPAALQTTVKDLYGNPVNGVTVMFSLASTGASATFGGSATAAALTNASGIATAPALSANSQAGGYLAKAAVAGIATPATFSLTNLPAAAAIVSATAGTPQSTTVGTAFAITLQATVTDAGGNPVSGVTVSFTAPAAAATASFSGSATTNAITNASGVATAPALTASRQTGTYTVSAGISGVSTAALFGLTNTAAVLTPPTLVQQAAGAPLGNNQTKFTVTLKNTPKNTDVLILFFDQVSASQTITSITGATWTRLAQNYNSAIGDAEIWVGVSPASSTITITGTNYFGTFQPGYATVAEFAGVSAQLDGPALLTAAGTWPVTTPKLITTNPTDLLLTLTLSSNGGGLSGTIKSPWTLFTPLSGNYSLSAAYQIVTAATSYSATWSGQGSPKVSTILLALKAAGSN